jgi:hypothetical protein
MLLAVQLPAWLSFFSLGWFLFHAVVIATVFFLGVQSGRRLQQQEQQAAPVKPPEA